MKLRIKLTTLLLLYFIFIPTIQADIFYPNKLATEFQPLTLTSILLTNNNDKNISELISDKKLGLLSKNGAIHVDSSHHRLWIHDTIQHINRIKHLILRFNKPLKQILLRARIVDIDSHYLRSLGVIFSTQRRTLGGNRYDFDTHSKKSQTGQFNIPLMKLNGGQLLDAKLSALQKQGHAQMISKPELVTLNGKTATIEAGEEVPYQETTVSGATNVAFKKAVIKLKVTADITPAKTILLNLNINQDKVSALTVNGVPAIHTQQMSTHVRMQDNQTLVLGGILEQTQSDQVEGIPVLSKIPLLGVLFRSKRHNQQTKELFVFITPSIVS